MRNHGVYALLALAIALSLAACGGGGGGGSTIPTPAPSVSPLLVDGRVAQYTGTDSIAYVYPSGGGTNFTASYTLKETATTEAASSGAPAPFDINDVTTFTTVNAPLSGTQKVTTTQDNYENQVASSSGLSIELFATKTVAAGTDITAGAAGGGPYTITNTDTTTHTTPLNLGTYPLSTGAVYDEPLGSTVATTVTDVNGGGQQPTTTFATQTNATIANDSSYTRTQQLSNSQQLTMVESSNGTSTLNETGSLFTLSRTVAAPAAGSSGYVIPVTQTKQNPAPAPTATPTNYSAVDWYPGNAAPPSPLGQETVTVKGPATTLPSGCSGAISEPNTYELDENMTTLDVDGSYQTITQQRFLSNGINVCSLTTTVTQQYAVTTGLLTSTSTENRNQILTSLTMGSTTASSRRP